jgi:surface antigen
VASSSAMWRKESVTIIESVEDVDEEEDEITNNKNPELAGLEESAGGANMNPPSVYRRSSTAASGTAASKVCQSSKAMRRASSGADSSIDENFLTVPQTVTASSSAETLTGNHNIWAWFM